MGFFVDDEPIPVYLEDDPLNIIYIKPRMGYASKERVQGAIVHLEVAGDSTDLERSFDISTYNVVLLRENIIRVEGPLFVDKQGRPLKYHPGLIEKFDPDHPLLDKVLAEINERNKSKTAELEGDDGVIEGEVLELDTEETPRPNLSNGVSKHGAKPSKALTRVK